MLGQLAWSGFSFTWGMVSLTLMASVAGLRDGAFGKRGKFTEEEKKELALARKKYWDLDAEPLPGFRHRFLKTRSGVSLHYVTNAGTRTGKKVVVFVHGFPDSYTLWRTLLRSPSLQEHILIAVDLPGYGGSDSLEKYDANNILEAMAGFFINVRDLYLEDGGELIAVAHDWGGIVCARLASEASQLAERWVIASAVIPKQTHSNILTAAASARQMLHTWLRWPFNPRLAKSAYITLKPALQQAGRSFYVFILNLPWPIASYFTRMGNFWFIRVLHWVQAGVFDKDGKPTRTLEPKEAADWLAMSAGPGTEQFTTTSSSSKGDDDAEPSGYSDSVRARIPDYGMTQKVRIYRENFILSPWEKSLETIVELSAIADAHPRRSSSGAGLFEEGPPGALKAPATLVYGRLDPAFSPALVLSGLGDYLVKGSRVLMVEKGEHWLPFEEVGAKVLGMVVEEALDRGRKESVSKLEGVTVVVQK